jgi:hypothetical protein
MSKTNATAKTTKTAGKRSAFALNKAGRKETKEEKRGRNTMLRLRKLDRVVAAFADAGAEEGTSLHDAMKLLIQYRAVLVRRGLRVVEALDIDIEADEFKKTAKLLGLADAE